MIRLRLFAFDDENIAAFEDALMKVHRHPGTKICVSPAGEKHERELKCDTLVEYTFSAPGHLTEDFMPKDEPLRALGPDNVVDRVLQQTSKILRQGGFDIILLDNTVRSVIKGDTPDYGVNKLLPVAREANPHAFIAIITGYPVIGDQHPEMLEKAFSNEAKADIWLPKKAETLCDTLCSIILLVAKGKKDRERREALEPLDQQNRAQLKEFKIPKGMVYESPIMAKTISDAVKGARSPDTHIFILGPSGAGKEHLADTIVVNDPRGKKIKFEKLNCSTLGKDENGQVSYFFGHKKGDYTGAISDHRGMMREVNGGNLFLNEIHTLSRRAQTMLHDAIEHDGECRDFKGRKYNVKVRIIAASNIPHEELRKYLNHDFLARLRQWFVHIPSLNQRRDDIRVLAEKFVQQKARANKDKMTIADDTIDFLLRVDWAKKDEVRGLENLIGNAFIRAKSDDLNQINTDCIKEAIRSLWPEETNSPEVIDISNIPNEITGDTWFSELDRDKLIKLCKDIWETKGGIIGNKADNIPYQLTIRQEHADYYIRAVLAIFFEAHGRNKKVFSRELFSKIFGFKEEKPNENPLRGLLQRKHKSNPEVFPKKETAETFQVSDLKADGYNLNQLKQNGIVLDIG
jgi:DNA-binding NtrC family response regulator